MKRFDEIILLANMAEKNTEPGGNITAINALTRSGLVLLCGYFEGFVREMCKEFVDELNELEIAPSLVPIRMLSEHVVTCSDKVRNNKCQSFSDFIMNVERSLPIQFDSDKLSSTNANPTVDTIERIFNVFDIPLVLDELSINDFDVSEMYNIESQIGDSLRRTILRAVDDDSVKGIDVINIIESRWRPKKKRRRVGYLNIIDELLKKRNRIAHGEGFDSVTPQELKEATRQITKLCDGLISKLTAKLAEMTYQTSSEY
ncbi:MAE_28990/MAE_18760 family HEPN-like nuclease [Jejubacter calystegiae]|nr:MAE_28990/MAE_18760 family HEPN-like nuclease [Jejubacter calystegiae]